MGSQESDILATKPQIKLHQYSRKIKYLKEIQDKEIIIP